MDNKKNNAFSLKAIFKASDLCYYAAFNAYKFPLSQKKRIEDNFCDFRDYIRLARDVAKQKEDSSAFYTVIDKNKEYNLSSWICFTVVSKIVNGKITTKDESFYQSLREMDIVPGEIEVKTIHQNGTEINPIIVGDKYFVQGKKEDDILINNDPLIAVSKENYIPLQVSYNGKTIPVINGKIFVENYSVDKCVDANISQIVFTLRKSLNNSDSNNVVIKLEDNPNADVSIYDTFFTDDAIEVYFEKRQDTYRIVKKDKEFGRLTINLGGRRIAPSGRVSLSVNLNQLNKQLDAIQGLMRRPSDYQRPLLNLAESYDYKDGKGLDTFFYRYTPVQYKILTDSSRDGVEKQREFVRRALQTPDFMILQGPPGSGKTTTILELIYQLAKQGKRVLLCASTHVAIDNVLEKIITHKDSEELLNAIHPVRVGDEDNVYSEPVKPFIYDNVIRGIPEEYRDLVENSFNLVCGTTIGVLKYPPLSKMITESKSSTTKPLFDYMIIDEASKTTFSEFLVPAATAKRWIIVGDVKQLAPYVEKNDLKPTLMACSALDKDYKRVGLSLIRELDNPVLKNKLKNHVLILSQDTIAYIDDAFEGNDNIIAVTNKKLNTFFRIDGNDLKEKNEKVASLTALGNVILLEDNLAQQTFIYLNKDYTILNHKEDASSLGLFQKYKIPKYRGMFNATEFRDYKKEFSNYAKSRDVVNEILWRLIRLYELNDDQRKAFSYKAYLSSLEETIQNEDERASYKKTIETLQGIAIPSIIMMLQEGIKSSSIKRASRIFGGLTDEEKQYRFIMLDYQHRMHPDISAVSRKNVYNEEALKDYRMWKSSLIDYPSSNPSRFEIRNIKNTENVVERNLNKAEVRAVVDELLKFLEYAKYHKKENGKLYEIAVLSFYNNQVFALRKELQKIFMSDKLFNFYNDDVHVSLNSVDRFQGQEADVVYLSMVQNCRLGFLDSVSRVNVAITRAKEKIIIFGDQNYFTHTQKESDFLLDIFRRG